MKRSVKKEKEKKNVVHRGPRGKERLRVQGRSLPKGDLRRDRARAVPKTSLPGGRRGRCLKSNRWGSHSRKV